MSQPKKPVVKKTTKKTNNDVQMYKGPKGEVLSGEGTNRGPNYNMLNKNGGKVMKKAQSGTKDVGGPTYSNLKIKNATAKDSSDYKTGYDNVKSGKKTLFPNRATSEGVNEALGRTRKKAQSGTSLGMKSVKAGAKIKKSVGKMKTCKGGC